MSLLPKAQADLFSVAGKEPQRLALWLSSRGQYLRGLRRLRAVMRCSEDQLAGSLALLSLTLPHHCSSQPQPTYACYVSPVHQPS